MPKAESVKVDKDRESGEYFVDKSGMNTTLKSKISKYCEEKNLVNGIYDFTWSGSGENTKVEKHEIVIRAKGA